ncbi:uroporphyrinogen-III synthase [Neobacillus kokaensis]|uniref:Uroporphyrinogen-III synthase n=1 Tax=Neobacillus kokaensis TaxID=2759023 RepID=A0ABQ3MZC9_9BACI|nr:uroporphyrinogen-III synthase [Neobacillus kokaensis]GHH97206.1 uroporphyrinogen-III synthase [Neobacillus kokaensis]
MIETPPLLGKRVLVPRGKDQATSFSKLVEEYGGIPIEIPLIAFRPIENNQCLEECLSRLDTYDWIIFTSNVTVETFFSFVVIGGGPGIDAGAVARLPKIAVIGKRTEAVLKKKGLSVEFVPTVYVAEAFVEEFLPYIQKGDRVLIPKGNLARDYIASSLAQAGAEVDEVVIYENYLPDESRGQLAEMLGSGQLDILTFTSPSTVDHLMAVVREYDLADRLSGCIIGCIGPITENRLREFGLPIHALPEEYTVKAMLASLVRFLEEEQG